ncbi:MAG: DEAD/DEAH box helicase [Actinobacteria bacterium]|jgi:superfamily II DNA/RNA helicase|nr:DEAD/DEAH box helicase [Actinomycetota bacterium]
MTEDTLKVSSFEELGVAADLVATLAATGITAPFPIQTLAIPDALAGRDVCGQAQTGSGKTIAFGIPLVERTKPGRPSAPRGLVLVPTRELCLQVAAEVDRFAAARGLGLAAIYGGAPMHAQIKKVRDAAIVVATPGRLIDMADRRHLSLEDVTTVVIDEADQMADMGFLPQVHAVMRLVGGGHQTMLFSATLDGAVASLIRSYMTDPVRFEADAGDEMADHQEHRFLQVHYMDKPRVVAAIANAVSRTLVFVGTKRNADRVSEDLRKEGVDAVAIHGDRQQSDREKALGRFSSGDLAVLVATNVASRGLHIDDVDVVIHYDPPDDYKSFIHRSGRTARAGQEGLVVTLVEWDQIEDVQRLQRASGLHQEIVKMFSNDPRLADLVGFEPGKVEFKRASDADLSRRAGRRRRR